MPHTRLRRRRESIGFDNISIGFDAHLLGFFLYHEHTLQMIQTEAIDLKGGKIEFIVHKWNFFSKIDFYKVNKQTIS